MQIKEREANAARALFLSIGKRAGYLISAVEQGQSMVEELDIAAGTWGLPLAPSTLPMWGAGSCGGGTSVPAAIIKAMGEQESAPTTFIHAPIMNSNGPRWSQCAKCRKVFGLSVGFGEGSHLWCSGCGQNLLLKNMTAAEFVELLKQYPQQRDENIGIVKLYNFEPTVKFGDFTESLSLYHQFGGRVKRRDSAEADAAQDLIMNHGANPLVIMRAANNKCVFARAEVQDGKLFIPVDRPVSLTSPLAIQMLLHFYAVRERYIPAPVSTWPPAQRAIVESFILKGLIREQDHEDYVTTDKGSLIVATLKAVMTESLSHV